MDYTVGKENGLKLYPASVCSLCFLSVFDEWKLDNSLECSQLEIYKKKCLSSQLSVSDCKKKKERKKFYAAYKVKRKMAWDTEKNNLRGKRKDQPLEQRKRFYMLDLTSPAVSHAGERLRERLHLGGKWKHFRSTLFSPLKCSSVTFWLWRLNAPRHSCLYRSSRGADCPLGKKGETKAEETWT